MWGRMVRRRRSIYVLRARNAQYPYSITYAVKLDSIEIQYPFLVYSSFQLDAYSPCACWLN